MRVAGVNLAELVGGFCLIVLGGFAVWEASDYPFGELTRMGPGYFPTVLGFILIVLGGAIIIEGRNAETAFIGVRPRAVVAIAGGMVAFGLLVDRLGVIPASVALVFIVSLADHQFRWITVGGVALALALFVYVVFIQLLGLSMRAFWWS